MPKGEPGGRRHSCESPHSSPLTPGFYFPQLSLKPGRVVWQCFQPILAASQVEQGSELESQHLRKDDHLCECLCNYVL